MSARHGLSVPWTSSCASHSGHTATSTERRSGLITSLARLVGDPRRRWPLSDNTDDDYLIALAQITGATLVTGDKGMHDDHPAGVAVVRTADLLQRLDNERA